MLLNTSKELARTWATATVLVGLAVLGLGVHLGFDHERMRLVLTSAAIVLALITLLCLRRWWRVVRLRTWLWWR